MTHICNKCTTDKETVHKFKSKDDYVKHGEKAIYIIFNDSHVMRDVADSLLNEIDEMDTDYKVVFIDGLFKDMKHDYTVYKSKYKVCNNINGCHLVENPKLTRK